jgi:hypothetical protein
MPYTSTRDVIVASICAIAGCAVAAGSVHAARRTRNWLFFVCAVGALAFAVGVAGQRVFPSEDAVRLEGSLASHHTPGPWDAGVQIPVLGIQATPVTVGGFLLAVVGLSLVLFFEAVPDSGRAEPPALPPVEEGDAV